MRLNKNFEIQIKDAFAARSEPEGERLLARFYWAILISFLTFVMVISVAYGAWEFMQTPRADILSGVQPTSALNRADIEKVLQGFDDRAKRFQDRLVAPIGVKDPS